MSSELMDALRELAREKNIDETAMLKRLEEQLAVTYKRILDSDNDCSVTIDRESGRITSTNSFLWAVPRKSLCSKHVT